VTGKEERGTKEARDHSAGRAAHQRNILCHHMYPIFKYIVTFDKKRMGGG